MISEKRKYNDNDLQVYELLVAQTKVRITLNRVGTARPCDTWKWKHILKEMIIPGDRMEEESEDTDDTGSMEPHSKPASMGFYSITESAGSSTPSSVPSILSPDSGIRLL